MKRIINIICLAFIILPTLGAQSHFISGHIENAAEGWIYLAAYYGDTFTKVDSMESPAGSFYFYMDEGDHAGVYRILFDEVYQGVTTRNRFIELIFNREDLDILIYRRADKPVAHFENSVENLVYLDFLKYELQYEAELTSMYGRLINGKSGNPQFDKAAQTYEALQEERNLYLDSINEFYPDLYVTRILNAFQSPIIPGSLSHKQRIDTLRVCYFNQTAIDDPQLLYAPVYTFKLLEFLSLFRDDKLDPAEQETLFIDAVDRIMINVSPDPELRSFVVNSLLEGFELLDMEQVQIHLADLYLDESCESDIVELVLSRMEGYKKMSEGRQAPDFVIREKNGRNIQLSMLPNPYVLVLFWSSTCEHCQDLLPELHHWYLHNNTLNMEVVAISIDTSFAHFEIFTDMLEPQWITSFDPLGWNGKVPSEYFIYSTPSLFLLDNRQTILARPLSYRQFLKAVRKVSE